MRDRLPSFPSVPIAGVRFLQGLMNASMRSDGVNCFGTVSEECEDHILTLRGLQVVKVFSVPGEDACLLLGMGSVSMAICAH